MMLGITLKNLWAGKRRLLFTVSAILLGVAFLFGTLVLTDTIRSSFNTLFAQVDRGTDALVRNSTRIGSRNGSIEESILAKVRSVDGVAAAEPSISGYGQLVGKNGTAIGGNGPPTSAGSWTANPAMNYYRLAEGRLPQADNEVIIDRGAAKAGHLGLGDTATLLTPEPVQVTIVGLSTFGSADSNSGVTFTAFTLAGAQKYVTKKPGQVSSIQVMAAGGVSQQQLVDRIAPTLPAGVEVITGKQLTAQTVSDVTGAFVTALTALLLVFAGVALLVATFSIYNTFTILAAQRTRETALLRALGASRSQVLGAGLAETALVGLFASALGLVVGLGIAAGLTALIHAFGIGAPVNGLTVKPLSLIIALAIGIVVALLAGILPAVAASRVLPLAALRDVAVERPVVARRRVAVGLGLLLAGLLITLIAIAAGTSQILVIGLGALILLAGLVVSGPLIAPPLSTAIAAPVARLSGLVGSLAQENALRNPRRTAGTAAALMIGIGVVTLFTVLAASLSSSITTSARASFAGDLAITTGELYGSTGLSPRLAQNVSGLPEVQAAVGIEPGQARLDGGTTSLTVADPAMLGHVLHFTSVKGSLAGLTNQQLAVSSQEANTRGWKLGTPVSVTFLDGTSSRMTVGALYAPATTVGDYLLSPGAWAGHSTQDADSRVLVALKPGVALADGRAAVQRVVSGYPGATLQDRQEYVSAAARGVRTFVPLVYILLVLAILIAVMGIANTLSLAVYERTREFGLLRAVGATRGQIRGVVCWEAVVVSVFGTLEGLALGMLLGWAVVRGLSSRGLTSFAAPPGQVLVVLVVGALTGVLAALLPARRAARLDVLRAIAAE